MVKPVFKKFPKIFYPSESLENNLWSYGKQLVTEKLDGSNAGITRIDRQLHIQSRRRPIAVIEDGKVVWSENPLPGIVGYFLGLYDEIIDLIPHGETIYGEWLIPHTVIYPDDWYNKFYTFPVMFPNGAAWYFPLFGILPNVPVIYESIYVAPEDEADKVEGAVTILDLIEELDRHGKREGYVLYKLMGGGVAKVVASKFQEVHKAMSGMKRSLNDNPETKMVATMPARSLIKVYEKVRDDLGREPRLEDMSVLLDRARQEFAEEWFWKAARAAGMPEISLSKLSKTINDVARALYIQKIQSGSWPMFVSRDS